MARKKIAATSTADVLQFYAANLTGDAVGAADGASAETPPGAPQETKEAPAAASEPEHKDIGQWAATYWRGRAIWRHKRTGQTQFKRSEVWRLRNLK